MSSPKSKSFFKRVTGVSEKNDNLNGDSDLYPKKNTINLWKRNVDSLENKNKNLKECVSSSTSIFSRPRAIENNRNSMKVNRYSQEFTKENTVNRNSPEFTKENTVNRNSPEFTKENTVNRYSSEFTKENTPTLTLHEELNNLHRYIYSLTDKKKQSSENIEAFFSNPERVREIREDLVKLMKQREWEKKSHDKLKKDLHDIDKSYDNTLKENYSLLASQQEFDAKIIKMEYYIQDLMHSNEIKLHEITLLKTQIEKLQCSSETLIKQNSDMILVQKTNYMENSFLRSQLLKASKDNEKLLISLSDKDKEISEIKSMNKELLFKSRSFSPVSDMSDDLSIDNIRFTELSPIAKPFEPFVQKKAI